MEVSASVATCEVVSSLALCVIAPDSVTAAVVDSVEDDKLSSIVPVESAIAVLVELMKVSISVTPITGPPLTLESAGRPLVMTELETDVLAAELSLDTIADVAETDSVDSEMASWVVDTFVAGEVLVC